MHKYDEISMTIDSKNPQISFHVFHRLTSFANASFYSIPQKSISAPNDRSYLDNYRQRASSRISLLLRDRKYSYDSRTSYEEMRAVVGGV